MSSSRAEPRSISTQLVLLFTLSAALLLSCSLGILYWVVVRHAFEEDNIVLADKVDALENALQQGGLDALSPEIHETHGSEYAFLVRVLDSSYDKANAGYGNFVARECFSSVSLA